MEIGKLLFSILIYVCAATALVVGAYVMYWIALRLPWLFRKIRTEYVEGRELKPLLKELSQNDRHDIFRMIEKIGNERSQGYLAFLLNHKPKNEQIAIKLPEELPDFPWVGKWVVVTPSPTPSADPIDFSIESDLCENRLGAARDVMFLKVPYFRAGGGAKRATSIFSIQRYLAMSTELSDHMARLFPRNPERLLGELLKGDIRIGLSPQWVQSARFHKCPKCQKSMRLIMQIDGLEFGGRLGEGEFYLFGCTRHPDQLASDQDWY